jgi:hypothetical protein
VIKFLAGAVCGAFGATYLLSLWLSATPETKTTGDGSVTYQSFLGSGPAT